MGELVGLVEHAFGLEVFSEDLEVAGLVGAGVFGDFAEAGVGAPLADFVADDGFGVLFDVAGVVGGGGGGLAIDTAFEFGAPGLDPRVGGAVVIVFGDEGPACCAGVEVAVVGGFP